MGVRRSVRKIAAVVAVAGALVMTGSGPASANPIVHATDLTAQFGFPNPFPYRYLTDGNEDIVFTAGDFLLHGNGYYTDKAYFGVQEDGNMVLYAYPHTPLWASHTTTGSYAIMQSDGNFVLYDSANRPLWASSTQSGPGSWLAVQADGNVVVYNPFGPIWATNTVVR